MKQSQWEISTDWDDEYIMIAFINARAKQSRFLRVNRFGDEFLGQLRTSSGELHEWMA